MNARFCSGIFVLEVKFTILVFVTSLLGPGGVYAAVEDLELDKFKITMGGYAVFRYDSKVSYTDTDVGAGVLIDPQDALGLNSEQNVGRISGYYRFNERHAFDFSYYKITSRGDKILEEEVDWIDEDGNEITLPVGAKVQSSLDYEILKLGYLWSFYHTSKVELSAGAGLHVAKINFDLSASRTGSNPQPQDGRATVPLPVFSFLLDYSITSNLSWLFKTELFGLKVEDVYGTYSDSTLALEYRLTKNFGLGFGFGSSALDVTETSDSEKFTYTNRISGWLLYASAHF